MAVLPGAFGRGQENGDQERGDGEGDGEKVDAPIVHYDAGKHVTSKKERYGGHENLTAGAAALEEKDD